MKVEHLSDDVTLYLGDCREIIPGIREIDAVVTDPPYFPSGFGETYNGHCAGDTKMAELGDDIERFDPRPFLLGKTQILMGADVYKRHLPEGGGWLVWSMLTPVRVGNELQIDGNMAWFSSGKTVEIAQYDPRTTPYATIHPFEKPVPIISWYLSFIPEACMILDPFMGGGSIGVAAVEASKGYVGIEVEPSYYDVACRRVSAAIEARREAA